MKKIILASASPRRVDLLKTIYPCFEVIPSSVSEEFNSETPEKNAVRLALEKAKDVSKKYNDSWILGADTIVALGNRIFGKPLDEEDAYNMLKALSGKTHTVITGVALVFKENHIARFDSSEVVMKNLTDTQITAYIKTGEPMDKAGAYAIQSEGEERVVLSHKGSYSNIVGLPLELVKEMLNQRVINNEYR